jgi:hypothetical protein
VAAVAAVVAAASAAVAAAAADATSSLIKEITIAPFERGGRFFLPKIHNRKTEDPEDFSPSVFKIRQIRKLGPFSPFQLDRE